MILNIVLMATLTDNVDVGLQNFVKIVQHCLVGYGHGRAM